MKVVLMGSHGVGKTTLLNNLKPEYKSLVIDEVIRDAASKDPNIKYNENGDAYSQKFFFNTYKKTFEESSDFISDRGLIDVLAYTKWLCDRKKINMGVYFSMYNDLIEFSHKNPDIAYIYLPIMFPVVDDGFRATDQKYRKQVDKLIRQLTSRINETLKPRGICPFFTITKDTLEDRIKEFEGFLDIIKSKENILLNNSYNEKGSN